VAVIANAVVGRRLPVRRQTKSDGVVDPAFVNTINTRGETPLHAAARAGLADLCHLLITMGGDVRGRRMLPC